MRANADHHAIYVNGARLEGCVGPVSCLLICETHVHKVLTRNSSIGWLVAMDHLAELRHAPGEAHAAVLGHDALRDSHKGRHGEQAKDGALPSYNLSIR